MYTYMSATLLLHPSDLEILICEDKMRLHLLEGLARDGVDAQLLLTLGQPEPELAPGRMPGSLAE